MLDRPLSNAARSRALRKRIALGTLVVIAFLWAVWDAWGLGQSAFISIIVGTLLLVLALAVLGALAGALLHWIRRRGASGSFLDADQRDRDRSDDA